MLTDNQNYSISIFFRNEDIYYDGRIITGCNKKNIHKMSDLGKV